jgi:hypothetical protein
LILKACLIDFAKESHSLPNILNPWTLEEDMPNTLTINGAERTLSRYWHMSVGEDAIAWDSTMKRSPDVDLNFRRNFETPNNLPDGSFRCTHNVSSRQFPPMLMIPFQMVSRFDREKTVPIVVP